MALSYGGRQAITAAARQLAQRTQDGSLQADDINEDAFEDVLRAQTPGLLPPDLLIR